MQELTFEQVEDVSGGSSCGAAEVTKRAYDAFFMITGGLIGGAITAGIGTTAGTALGGIASELAWAASKDDVIQAFCNK